MVSIGTEIGNSHFGKRRMKALLKKGIVIVGLTYIPGEGSMPMATGTTGYCLSDNDTGQVLDYLGVLALLK